ncbi:hypothetical protein RCL1_003335 [Eukaryota sp. TZLM3-RCL]
MSQLRKLLNEIERTQKRVEEGAIEFEDIWARVHEAPTAAQREKHEAELKKTIKKLQRYRDQIRTWIGSSEIKDKRNLEEGRKRIEVLMERFKIIERQSKTKAYSREGLAQAAEDEETLKVQVLIEWFQRMISELEGQVEQHEANIETISARKRGSKKMKQDDLDEIESAKFKMERHRHHIKQMELIMRLLTNGDINPDAVELIKDSLEYYVTSNEEPEFFEDMELYDQLELDEIAGTELENIGILGSTRSEDQSELDTDTEEKPPVPVKKAQSTTSVSSSSSKVKESQESFTRSDSKRSSAAPSPIPTTTKSLDSKQPVQPKLSKSTPPITPYCNIPSNIHKNNSSSNLSASAKPSSPLPASLVPKVPPKTQPSPVLSASAPPLVTETRPSSASQNSIPTTTPQVASNPQSNPPIQQTLPSSPSISSSDISSDKQPIIAEKLSQSSPAQIPVVSQENASKPKSILQSSTLETTDQTPIIDISEFLPPPPPEMITTNLQLPPVPEFSYQQIMSILEKSAQYVPTSYDSRPPNRVLPRNPYKTPSFFPQQSPSFLNNPQMFEKLDVDTLFYIFFFHQSSPHQFLAAKELKRQHWRFHKKFLTFFRRHQEPKTATDDYEEGAYVYFDYEPDWTQRIKNEFKFTYEFLEDELQV